MNKDNWIVIVILFKYFLLKLIDYNFLMLNYGKKNNLSTTIYQFNLLIFH